MGVAWHGGYFAWFEVGRTDLLRARLDLRDLEAQDLRLPVIEAQARFLRPALYDDVLEIRTTVTAVSGARVAFAYEVAREGTEGLLATGATPRGGDPGSRGGCPKGCAGCSCEGGGHGRGRVHRLAPRGCPPR
jgi:YbgC/YbaW family acyl-CoA thioester hydrolase